MKFPQQTPITINLFLKRLPHNLLEFNKNGSRIHRIYTSGSNSNARKRAKSAVANNNSNYGVIEHRHTLPTQKIQQQEQQNDDIEIQMPRLDQLRKRLAMESNTFNVRNNIEFFNTISSCTNHKTSNNNKHNKNHSSNNKHIKIYKNKQNNIITRGQGINNTVKNNVMKNHDTRMTWKDIVSTGKEVMKKQNICHNNISNNKNYNHHEQKAHHQQNLSVLTDSFQRQHSYLRISLGERCNLRCLYCMPPEGVPLQPNEKLLTRDEIERLVTLFSYYGVDKVRLTGGEPLLRKDLPHIISSISSNPNIKSVGITTNGITLSRQLPTLVENGLTHANISLDTLQSDKFLEITRRHGLSQVRKAIEDASKQLPEGNVKVNCVVMKGFNDNELRDFVLVSKDLPIDIRFIEWMPFNDNGWSKDRFMSYDQMFHKITSSEYEIGEVSMHGLPALDLQRLEDGPHDTTKWWKVPGHKGRVGFITSMTQHFCGSCNRLRITADGQLKVCLFGSAEISLREAMREGASDEDLALIIWTALQKKHFALGGHGNAEGIKKANDNRPMTLIGG